VSQPVASGTVAAELAATAVRSNRLRYLKDSAARYVVLTGGLGVILALLLIFVYLVSEVGPLFIGADMKPRRAYVLPGGAGGTLHIAAEEQGEVGLRLLASGDVAFFDLSDGTPRQSLKLPLGATRLASVAEVSPEQAQLAAGLADGSVLIFRHSYALTYPDDKRLITPSLEYPYGEKPLAFLAAPGRNLAVRDNDGKILMASADAQNVVHLKGYEATTSFTGETSFGETGQSSVTPKIAADLLLMNPLQDWLYVIDKTAGKIEFYRLQGAEAPELVQTAEVGAAVQDARFLAGGISVIVAQADGRISQWFPARDANGDFRLARVRDFELDDKSVITAVAGEHRRRTFAAGDEHGRVSLFYATSGRNLLEEQVFDEPVALLAFNPRAKVLVAVGQKGTVRAFDVHNEHPEVSFGALWRKIWYESYDRPDYIWQSSSASADFEPKLSLVPLSIGTLKGALYAMAFAIPLAILGAIFTSYFMSPEMRQVVKPAVEILAALPSVILGFLAGLWLAPFVETNLAGVFLTLLLLPLSIPVFGYLWLRLPARVRYLVPAGWEAALLIPVIAGIVWLCFLAALPIEAIAFGGNLQAWMDQTLGIGYQQRNALVVGIAMGIAVIPVIFSIAEDALFSVPKHLTLGSLALGATSWQTLIGVVLPTASPGIFSAIMIGLGRAVGETMIVLMATGNTPVTDFSMFTGMRTLAANVAVEMPESEVGSTHFRTLFLAGLVLFLFTFLLNTGAEVVRQRLRKKYSNL
jgi:phosphate transport system permease protein